MSKLVLIGLAVATLGIGGFALPSHDDKVSVSTESALVSTAEASALDVPPPVGGLTATIVTPAAVAESRPVTRVASVFSGPFERSATLCASGQYQCIGLGSLPDRPVTMAEFLGNVSFERVKTLNGWSDGEVTLDTIVPRRKMIAFDTRRS